MAQPYDAGKRQDVRKAEKAQKAAAESRANVLRNILATRPGRDWIYSLLEECRAFNTPFVVDSNATAFNCGEQNIGFRLLAQVIEATPEAFTQMLRERNERFDADDLGKPGAGDAANHGTDDVDNDIYD